MPEAGKSAHLEILRQWAINCDSDHEELSCQQHQVGASSVSLTLPTRLIDVGGSNDAEVRLWEPSIRDVGAWIALSHPWGPPPHFSTNRQNLSAHIAGMRIDELPQTFRDAITVTRSLGLRYLWIDSLCIIQGDGGDFSQESKRMEEVYSGAYCVIAASRTTSHYSGFLGPRVDRDHVSIRRCDSHGGTFHICQIIDNFKEHVLDGRLNRRGWVLQEHALARRTIFFTEHQTYWECGHGVRCETMTRMTRYVSIIAVLEYSLFNI